MASDDALPPRLLDLTTYVLSLSGRAARARIAERLAHEKLTMADMAALAALADFGTATQRDLGPRLRLDPADLARLLDRLDARRLVAREPDPDDRRRRLVSITAPGRRVLRRCEQVARAVQDEILQPLDADERRELHALLTRVLAGVDPRAAR